MSNILRIGFALICGIMAIAAFTFGGLGIVAGIVMLCAAFVALPFSDSLPVLSNIKTEALAVIIFIVGIVLMVVADPGSSKKQNSAPDSQPVPQTSTTETTVSEQATIESTTAGTTEPEKTESTKSDATTTTAKETTTTATTMKNQEDTLTIGQRNAVNSAVSYIDTLDFSHDGLVEQLEFSGFSHDEAVYGADHCGADWKSEALGAAKSYIDTLSYSYKGLIEQLEYSKFTKEQAKYGADNCNADWNQEAAEAAQSYIDTMSMSRDALKEQLDYVGFTESQIKYALSAVGY